MPSISRKLSPFLSQLLTSDKLLSISRRDFALKTKLLPQLDYITFYHRLDDPYSLLLLQVLPDLVKHYQIKLKIKLLLNLVDDLNPEPEKFNAYAIKDAHRLAERFNLKLPKQAITPASKDKLLASQFLLTAKNNNPGSVLKVTQQLWNDTANQIPFEINSTVISDEEAKKITDASLKQLLANGHYMSAMLHYGKEWYWGLDRLGYLISRLESRCSPNNSSPPIYCQYPEIQQHNYLNENTTTDTIALQSIDFYFSFRSPYSYLAAVRLFNYARTHNLNINILPVMPMVMRGLKVPKAKRFYIIKDCKRIARRYGIPFGKIYDPLGGGIERCQALFIYAKSHSREKEFILSIASGIWSEAADVCRDKVLSKLINRAGLDWQQAKKYLKNTDWKQEVESNRHSLNRPGLWGVPSFDYNGISFWGQDRLWLIAKELD